MDIMGMKQRLAVALRELVNEGSTFANGNWGPADPGWSAARLQVVMGSRTMFTMFTDLGEVSFGLATPEVIDEVTHLCATQRSESDSRPLVVEMTLAADGEATVAYSLGLTSELLGAVVIDPTYRHPGHPAPGMPQPTAAQLSGAPTDPSVLATVSGLAIMLMDNAVELIIASVIIGGGVGIAYAAMPALIMGSVPQTETASANGLNSLMRSVGTSTSSAVMATMLAHLTITVGALTVPSLAGFRATFVVAAAAALVGLALTALVPRAVPARELVAA